MSSPSFFQTHVGIDEISDADVSAVISLWNSCGLTRPWNDAVRDIATVRKCPTAIVLVARALDGVVGTAVAGFDGHWGCIYYLAVDPCLRGNGIGRALVEHGEAWLAQMGASNVRLQIQTNNAGLVAFGHKLGYGNQDVVTLGKRLEPV